MFTRELPSTPTVPTPGVSCTSRTAPLGTGNPLFDGPVATKSAFIAVSVTSATEAFIDAPSIPTAPTRASPKVRAKAVVAVRRGFRAEFFRASAPMVPKGSPTTRPIPGTARRATAGEARNVPRMTRTAAAPTRMALVFVFQPSPSAPATAIATPTAKAIPPAMVRPTRELELLTSPERIASTGRVAPALRAGAHALRVVTITPTIMGSATAIGVRTIPPAGSPAPVLSRTA